MVKYKHPLTQALWAGNKVGTFWCATSWEGPGGTKGRQGNRESNWGKGALTLCPPKGVTEGCCEESDVWEPRVRDFWAICSSSFTDPGGCDWLRITVTRAQRLQPRIMPSGVPMWELWPLSWYNDQTFECVQKFYLKFESMGQREEIYQQPFVRQNWEE